MKVWTLVAAVSLAAASAACDRNRPAPTPRPKTAGVEASSPFSAPVVPLARNNEVLK
jgi:hypothetical protein